MHIHLDLSYMQFEWDVEKNERLKRERGVSFEEVVRGIHQGKIVNTTKNPSIRYSEQYVIRINISDYIYRVPCIIVGNVCRLITIFPCRKDKHLLF